MPFLPPGGFDADRGGVQRARVLVALAGLLAATAWAVQWPAAHPGQTLPVFTHVADAMALH
eukprot:6237388-Lingulodinium_polyedra.AAC.1